MDVMVETWFKFTYHHFGSFWGWNDPFLAPVKKQFSDDNDISDHNDIISGINNASVQTVNICMA